VKQPVVELANSPHSFYYRCDVIVTFQGARSTSPGSFAMGSRFRSSVKTAATTMSAL
jgi:hypothetical protein